MRRGIWAGGRAWAAAACVAVVVAAAGCDSGPVTHPVNGRLELPGGDVAKLAGSTIEVSKEGEPGQRSGGTIQADGRFTLETLYAGKIRDGALEGRYKARIIPADDDTAARKRAAGAVAGKYLKFETSGLSVSVPADGEVVLTLAPR